MKHVTLHPFALLAVVVVLGGASFYAGTALAKKPSAGTAAFQGANGQRRAGGAPGAAGLAGGRFGANGGFSAGEILKKDDTGFTLKLNDGGSLIVFYSASTSVMKTETVDKNTLAEGVSVTVSGKKNTDGSLVADQVQIRDPNAGPMIFRGAPPAVENNP